MNRIAGVGSCSLSFFLLGQCIEQKALIPKCSQHIGVISVFFSRDSVPFVLGTQTFATYVYIFIGIYTQ